MSFVISLAPEIFQRKDSQTFGVTENAEVCSEDLIVTGKSESEHDIALKKTAIKINI